MDRQRRAIETSLDTLEAKAMPAEDPTIGEIASAAFLGYLDFRWSERDWRPGRPRLADWFERFSLRPSMSGTPHAPPVAATERP